MKSWKLQARERETHTHPVWPSGTRRVKRWSRWSTVQSFDNETDAFIAKALNSRAGLTQYRITLGGKTIEKATR